MEVRCAALCNTDTRVCHLVHLRCSCYTLFHVSLVKYKFEDFFFPPSIWAAAVSLDQASQGTISVSTKLLVKAVHGLLSGSTHPFNQGKSSNISTEVHFHKEYNQIQWWCHLFWQRVVFQNLIIYKAYLEMDGISK